MMRLGQMFTVIAPFPVDEAHHLRERSVGCGAEFLVEDRVGHLPEHNAEQLLVRHGEEHKRHASFDETLLPAPLLFHATSSVGGECVEAFGSKCEKDVFE